MGTLLLSNSQRPGLYGKIHVHGETGASVGVQTDGGSPFVSGMTEAVEPPRDKQQTRMRRILTDTT